jgi:hypothetical protein
MDIPTPEELVSHYEAFCKRHDMAETRFGREATGEPQLIQSIRNGRSPSLNVLNRVKAYIAEKDSGACYGGVAGRVIRKRRREFRVVDGG